MKRMWLRWVLMGLFVVALGFTFVSLGQWQLDRLDQRRDRNANVVTHEQAPVVTFEDAFSHVITEQDQWQRVEVSGTFLPEPQLQARYRSHNDEPDGTRHSPGDHRRAGRVGGSRFRGASGLRGFPEGLPRASQWGGAPGGLCAPQRA
ncbi:SURF1 family cytochrome oxidase biogenesis protein, partial [Propioniciclava flava]